MDNLEEETYEDCVKDNSQVEETYEDCYKTETIEEKEETYEDCYKQPNKGGITLEYLVNCKNKLRNLRDSMSPEARAGKYRDSKVESYESVASMLIGLGKIYFDIDGDISLEEISDLIDEEVKKQKNK